MVSRRYGYQHYDSMIIAAALQAGCERLYSEDMQHRQTIDKTTTDRESFYYKGFTIAVLLLNPLRGKS
jgi:predicted nucleic acid-binding protein